MSAEGSEARGSGVRDIDFGRRGETLRGGGGERRGRLEERGGERGDDEGRRGWNVGYRRRCVHGDEFARLERDSKSPGKESSVSEDTDY